MNRVVSAAVIPICVTLATLLIIFLFSRVLLLVGDAGYRPISTGIAIATAMLILILSAVLSQGGSRSS